MYPQDKTLENLQTLSKDIPSIEALNELENQVIKGELPPTELELLILSVGFLKSFYLKQLIPNKDKQYNFIPEQLMNLQNKFDRLEQLQRQLWSIQRKLIGH